MKLYEVCCDDVCRLVESNSAGEATRDVTKLLDCAFFDTTIDEISDPTDPRYRWYYGVDKYGEVQS